MPKPILLIITNEKQGPSLSYLKLTRNPHLASPVRFEPTQKAAGDIVL